MDTEVRDLSRPTLLAMAAAAAGYWACGKLSLMLALPTGYSCPIWPAAGVALIAVLTYRGRIVPALMLGSFLLNAGIAFDWTGPAAIARSAALALLHSSGQIGQALLGAALVRRFVGWPNFLGRPRSIVAFVLLAGPVACVLSPTVGNATLWAVGVVPAHALPMSWLTWWVGDVIGVVLVAPLLLSFVGRPAEAWRRRRVSLGLPVAGAVLFFGACYVIAGRAEAERLRQSFRRDTEARVHLLEESLCRSVDALRGLRGLFRGSESVSREEFLAASSELRDTRSGLQALEWLPAVPDAERDAFEASTGVRIVERDAGGAPVPRARADRTFPILFVDPLAGNEPAVGFDPSSEPTRAAVLRAAAESGEARATEPVGLVQDASRGAGVVVFLPYFGRGAEPTAPEERWDRCAGFLVAVYRVDAFVSAALREVAGGGILASLRDRPTGRWIFGPDDKSPHDPAVRSIGLELVQSVRLPGREWESRFFATPEYIADRRSIAPWAVLAGGLILSSLLGAFLLRETGRSAEVEAVVVERTAALQQANQELEALSLLDPLTRIANRRSLDATLEREWERARRAREPLSLLMCDIDFFKKFNDSKGHPAGDEALRQVAREIRGAARRPADATGRYGGEEFLVILPNTPIQGAVVIAGDIRRAVAGLDIPHPHSPSGRLSISIGAATAIPTETTTAQALLDRADRALYRAKEEGRNRVATDSVLSTRA